MQMNTSIDDMIDIISSDIPEFLDSSKSKDIEAFNYISYLILMSKILCVDSVLGISSIIKFTDEFFNIITDMTTNISNEKSELCYSYVVELYDGLFTYLEKAEEYEMCSNFRNFIREFNDKVSRVNDELEE